jgi:hypothetical protein
MINKDIDPDVTAELRRRAEELAKGKAVQIPEQLEVLTPEETHRMLHELRVHQIELEMQMRNCGEHRSSWTPFGPGILTSTIWRRWAIALSPKKV